MANAVKEIGEIVKQCKVLLLDIEGTTTSISFVKDKLFPYAEEKVQQFLESQWETDEVKEAVAALRKLALEDKENVVEGVVDIPAQEAPKEEQVEGLVKNVKWQMSIDRKVGALKQLQGLIWKKGYDNGDIKGHVYDDVAPALEQWRSTEGHQVFIYSSGSVQAQKLLFGQSSAGDLLKYIDGHFDTAVGGKQEAASYTSIVEKIACKADEILFLTDIVKEAEAARTSGLHVALVSREGNAALPDDAVSSFPVLHSLAQLTSNKRKQEPQDEQPAKMAKTDSVEAAMPAETETETKTTEEPEKMEVENGSDKTDQTKTTEENKTEEPTVESTKVETVIEEETDSVKSAEAVDKEPLVTEVAEKDKEAVEKTSQNGHKENGATEKKVDDVDADMAEETATVETTITEIEGSPEDVAEIIEGLEPVVEEPPADEEMQDLQNVGEVLEKECDEILSKVQDVTNLESIPLKPLLNPIAEENMETENGDTNDIMDKILDSELEMEMKQCGEIDLNTVSEITDEGKTETAEESPKEEAKAPETSSEVTEKVDTKEESSPTEKNSDNKTPETKLESPAEEVKENGKTEEVKVEEEKEPKLNGNSTNGDAESGKLNGDSSKDELSSRLTVENDKVNGSNGDTADVEKGQGDNKVEAEVVDIKVKTVAVDEPRTDPIELPTEA